MLQQLELSCNQGVGGMKRSPMWLVRLQPESRSLPLKAGMYLARLRVVLGQRCIVNRTCRASSLHDNFSRGSPVAA